MKIPVVVEKVKGKDMVYQARSGEPMAASAEGPTPDEALRKLREVLTERIYAGAWLEELDIPAAEDPMNQIIGMYEDVDEETWEDFQRVIAENRKKDDEDLGIQ